MCATLPLNMSSSLSHHHHLHLLWLSTVYPYGINQAMISSSIKRLKARRRNSLFWKIKIIIIFNMIILGTWKCYYMVLLQQDFNTGLFRVLQHVMDKWFRTIHGQQILATLFTFARYSWLAKLGYGYLAMISRLLSLANWRLGSARNRLRLRLKTAKSLSRGNTTNGTVTAAVYGYRKTVNTVDGGEP